MTRQLFNSNSTPSKKHFFLIILFSAINKDVKIMQNRVNPFGEIIETTARGLWMGNRGNIHNHDKRIVRAYKLKAWITCKLEFKGRKREIMAPNLYTELFFLDEATSFAAGHRPCFECRREDYNKFKTAWLRGNTQYKFSEKTHL